MERQIGEITDALIARIRDGRSHAPEDGRPPPGALVPFTRLPSVRVMAKEHGVAMGTMQAAMNYLRRTGYILNASGRTNMVAPAMPLYEVHEDRMAAPQRDSDDLASLFRRRMSALGWDATVDLHYVGEMVAPEWAVGPLGLAPGSTVWGRLRILRATPMPDGEPAEPYTITVELHDTVYPMSLLERVPSLARPGSTGRGGEFSRMEEAGLDLVSSERIFSPFGTSAEAALLNVSGDERLDEMLRIVSDGDVPVCVDRELGIGGWKARTYRVPMGRDRVPVPS